MVDKLSKDVKDLHAWLETQAIENKLPYLLAFADDGVIWGWFDGEHLTLAPQACVPLRIETIQHIHLFGQAGELRIVRTITGFESIWLDDSESEQADQIDERYLLWGEGELTDNHFTLMEEGLQGLRHMPPILDGKGKAGYIGVRHYVCCDSQGQAYISHSRLLSVDAL